MIDANETTSARSEEVVLEVNNLVKIYRKADKKHRVGGAKLKAVDDISFAVKAGEIVGFLGPNGAGKSTTIKMITGLAAPTSGTIKVCGYDVQKDPELAKAHIGGVIEYPDMYANMSAEGNLKFFASLRSKEDLINPLNRDEDMKLDRKALIEKRVEELLILVGLYDRKNDAVKKYSLGMKQRLGIAQAIMEYPKLLVLDEPANGLDPAGIKGVRLLLKQLAAYYGMAIIVSSHQLAEMEQLCERVIIIDSGKIIADRYIGELEENEVVDAGGKTKVSVKTDKPSEVATFLREKYGEEVVESISSVSIRTSANPADITRELIFAGYNIYGVETEKTNLEDVYIDATREDR